MYKGLLRRPYKSLIILFILIFSLSSLAKKLPVEAFASLPSVDNVRLSPNGKLIASLVQFTSKRQQGSAVEIFDTTNNTSQQLLISDNKKYSINSIVWANNQQLLVGVSYAIDRKRIRATETRLLKIDVKTGKQDEVIKKSYLKHLVYMPNIQTDVVDYLPKDNNHILMSIAGKNEAGEETVIKVNLDESKNIRVKQSYKKNVYRWLTDSQHNVRIAVQRRETEYAIKEIVPDTGEYRTLWRFSAFSREEIWPLGFGLNNNELYVSALHKGKKAIFTVDLTDRELKKTLVLFNDDYDVSSYLRRSKLTGEIIGIGNTFIASKYKKFQRAIDRILPNTNNTIVDFSANERRYIILARSDTEAGVYYLGDRDTGNIQVFDYKYKQLLPELLSDKKTINYKARDGLSIEGFVTLPKTGKQKNLPTIIFPHGGPISYDDNSFDYWTQFFANQGYAVLQMNFRGSSGYGFDFMQQGLTAWGKSMQDDVEDGTRWMIKQGYSDKDNICIVGASYGGYAALMAGVKTPELYQCIVSFAGVTDLEYLLKNSEQYRNYKVIKKQIGDDWAELWDRSPLKYANKITIPVLLLHGSDDRTVDVRHSTDMFSALKKAHKKVNYVELNQGDHYLSNNAHRITTFKAMEKFLSEHLRSKATSAD